MIPLHAEEETFKSCKWHLVTPTSRSTLVPPHPESLFRAGRLIICLILALFGSFPAQGGEIHKAVVKGDLNTVVVLLKDHPELIENKDKMGLTPLNLAVKHNQLEIAALLLANSADVNARDPHQRTPLILALWVYNHDKMMRLLLASGADVDLSDQWSMTALAYAAQEGKVDDAKILIANDANINFESGTTPLVFAVMGTHTEMVELLLANGADPNHKVGGFTPLYFAKQMYYETNQISDPKIEVLLKKYGGHE
jgi:ankyrin repeat protein